MMAKILLIVLLMEDRFAIRYIIQIKPIFTAIEIVAIVCSKRIVGKKWNSFVISCDKCCKIKLMEDVKIMKIVGAINFNNNLKRKALDSKF
jgi:hypothetical protein